MEVNYELRFYLFDFERNGYIYIWGQMATEMQIKKGLLDKLAEFCWRLPFAKGKIINVRIKERCFDEQETGRH